jgi:NAD(P)-dependent dehydrogenase (short-subunit alcohol dehydrogenase family)
VAVALKLKPLNQQVVVITGASSGIGLATARMAAARGARVVLAARTREALAQAVDEIKQAGGEAMFVEADVGDRDAVERIAAQAEARFGAVDTWVNDAGVMIFGPIEKVEEADARRLFDTNFWGTVHGSLAAVRRLREGGGALINVGSVESDRAFPLQGYYAASKHAVKGFTDALRTELEADGAPVSVTLIKPASIGTPMPQHAHDLTGAEPKFPPPVYDPNDVAETILRAAEVPIRDAFVGGAGPVMSALASRAPGLMDWISATFLGPAQIGDRPATPGSNLFEGKAEGEVYGDHQGSMIRPSLYTAAARNRAVTAAVAGVAAAAGTGLFLWSRSRGARSEVSTAEEVEAHPS